MKISKTWLWFSTLASVLMAGVSFMGIFSQSTYAEETLNWATQASAQDYVNLFVAFPAILISAYFVHKGSFKAYLIWLGVLSYMIYSYVLYAFFIHFGPNFLPYVAILGLSFYAATGSLVNLDRSDLNEAFSKVKGTSVGNLLAIVSVIFYFLWLSDIGKALSSGTLPAGVSDIGLFVNPIQVLDLAFVLPGAIMASYCIRKRHVAGLLFAVPLMVFFSIMGIAIIAIFASLAQTGSPSSIAQYIFMTTIILFNLFYIRRFLKDVSEQTKGGS